MKKKILRYLIPALLIITLLYIFRSWFSFGTIAGGDLDYQWNFHFFLFPYAWNVPKGDGLGMYFVPLLWVYVAQSIPFSIFGTLLHLPWEIVERIVLFYPFLILCAISPLLLYRNIIQKHPLSYLAAFLYVTNTYILNVVQGGQMLYALAYALVPLTLLVSIKTINKNNLRQSVIMGLLLSIQLLLDIRVTYVLLFAVVLYFVLFSFIYCRTLTTFLKECLFACIIPGCVTILLHAFWLFPLLFYRDNPIQQLESVYTSVQSVQFFSFAKFEDAFSLLHPNWPDNLFGKVYFMRPEFIILPILAYLSLIFINSKLPLKSKNNANIIAIRQSNNLIILFFAFLGLLGAFLAKGANDPFGGIYLWLFGHVPGFVMFRDPTKWYILIAISYSVLIPLSAFSTYTFINAKFKLQNLKLQKASFIFISLLFIAYLLFLIRPVFFEQLHGTFKTQKTPQEYILLANFLSKQDSFSRTLWLPTIPSYGYFSPQHPAVTIDRLFPNVNTNSILGEFSQAKTERLIQQGAIQYVIIPYDSEGTIFTKDHAFDPVLYKKYVDSIKKISWLHEVSGFGNLHVFAVTTPQKLFSNNEGNTRISYSYDNPTKYTISVKNAKEGDRIIFSETYNPHWIAKTSDKTIKSTVYEKRFNSFVLQESGDYNLIVSFQPQSLLIVGLWISCISLLFIVSFIIFFQRKSH